MKIKTLSACLSLLFLTFPLSADRTLHINNKIYSGGNHEIFSSNPIKFFDNQVNSLSSVEVRSNDSIAIGHNVVIKAGSSFIASAQPIGEIKIDGSFSDWLGTGVSKKDSVGEGDGQSEVDFEYVWFMPYLDQLFVSYQTVNHIDLNQDGHRYNIYFDTDRDAATGYQVNGIGADVLMQSSSIYNYTGDGQSWNWSVMQSLSYAVNGQRAEFSIPKSLVGGSNFDFHVLVFGDNDNEDDYVNDDGTAWRVRWEDTFGNNPPQDGDMNFHIPIDFSLNFNVSAIDLDPNSSLVYRIAQNPQNGIVSGSFPALSYKPNDGYIGSDSFVYAVSDLTDEVQFTITLDINNDIVIDGKFFDWEIGATHQSDPTDDVSENEKVNFSDTWSRLEEDKIYLSYKTTNDIDLNNEKHRYNIFIDVDGNLSTGYEFDKVGADYLIQGDYLYVFSGTDSSDWSWQVIGEIENHKLGNRIELSISKNLIGSNTQNISLLYFGDNDGIDDIVYVSLGTENNNPVAIDDIVVMNVGTNQIDFNVVSNDYDLDSDPIIILSYSQAQRGGIEKVDDHTLRYLPNDLSYQGIDTLQYSISDGNGGIASANVTINIVDPNSNVDLDNDGMVDHWEIVHFGSISASDGTGDVDGDTLNDLDEFLNGTNPNNKDSDGDGMDDNLEVLYGLNPNEDDGDLDLDEDGIDNKTEIALGSDPSKIDTDKDGMPDGWEHQFGLNLLVNDAHQDSDNDGLKNLREWNLGTRPNKGYRLDINDELKLRVTTPLK